MAKKLISDLILARLALIWASRKFFVGSPELYVAIVGSYHRMEFQGKPIIQTQENAKKPHFGSDLGHLGTNLCR